MKTALRRQEVFGRQPAKGDAAEAAATRYAVGLVYLSHRGSDPEAELVLLENMILKEFSTGTETDCR